MGTWAVDAFGNDNACDWAFGIEKTKGIAVVEKTLDKALAASDYLEAPDAAEALAAVEVVARLRGKWGERNAYSKPVDNWVSKTKLIPDASLCAKAVRVIDRVLSGNSELKDLWEESDGFVTWKESVEELKRRVTVSP